MEQNRHILHMDMDTFFVSVERLRDNQLIGKPLIIGGASDRGVVASCSYETRKYGVHSAMPIKLARRLCPDAIIIRPDMDAYSKKSQDVTEIIKENAPVVEKASIDEHYLDLTGMDKFFGCLKWSHELRERIIKETGLPISLGLSVNKTVSKIATGEAKPSGELQVNPMEVKPFLFPLPVRKIPGVGEKSAELLRGLGILKIKTMAETSLSLIKRTLGENGISIWKKANGIDNAPVVPYSEAKSISTEQTFEQDTTDKKFLSLLIKQMVEELAFKLRQQEKLTSCVTVKIKYSDFDTHTAQKRIPYTSFDHTLYEVAHELLYKLYQRRVLVRLVGVKLSGLVPGVQQINMFEDSMELVNLYQAIDKMKNRFGEDSITRGYRI